MNERINQLFEQALADFKAEHEYATIIVPNPLREKFAELLVCACADYVFSDEYDHKEMLKHFGIELDKHR